MAFAVFIFALLLKVSTALSSQNITHLFSTVLIFGDSTADSGNNNYINTPLKADHPPYGEDFPGKIPTDRFSNGKLVSDFWASLLGIKQTVPPFLQLNISDFDIRTGVNFTSAGSGYNDMTAQISQVITVTKQLYYFKEYIKRLKKVVGIKVEGALVSISVGTNDFMISYYDLPSRRDDFSMDDYQDYILKKLQNFVNELYKHGCQTMVVSGLPLMGCLPIQMLSRFSRTCLMDQNTDARVYNQKLMNLLSQIQSSLKGSQIMYTYIYTPMMEMIRNPRKHDPYLNTDAGTMSPFEHG